MKVFVGITIGPIVEVLCETSTPAALWFGSNMFSDITRRLCEGIKNEWSDSKIYSPFFEADTTTGYPSDGVGKYHDRVIFSIEDQSAYDEEKFVSDISAKLKGITSTVKKNTIDIFPAVLFGGSDATDYEQRIEQARIFLEQYLQIHFVIVNEKKIESNAVLALSPYLDELELMKSFPGTSNQNIIMDLFSKAKQDEDESVGVNDLIRESALFKAILKGNNGFLKDYKFKTLKDISNADNDLQKKYSKYYAVVTADGDKMGKFLESINTDDVAKFSRGCLEYNIKAAETVKRYGGMPIYAGGDDLLFVAPVMGKADDGKRIFISELCKEINKMFALQITSSAEKEGLEFKNIPSISFGISINYYKYPLYEAFSDSRSLLEDIKNGKNGPEKNSIAIGLQKHSGQSLTLYVGNEPEAFDSFMKFFHMDISDSKRVNSLLYKLSTFSALFDQAYVMAKTELSKDRYRDVWKNLFDNSGQKEYLPYVINVADSFFDGFIKGEPRIRSGNTGIEDDHLDKESDNDNKKQHFPITILEDILRLEKFYVEKAGDD